MFSKNKSEEMESLLKKVHRKNLGAFFTMNGTEYLSCTCGIHKKIDPKKIAIHTEDRAGRYLTIYQCPSCGTDLIIPYADVEGSNVPVYFEHEVLRDDDLFWVMSLSATWIHLNANDSDENGGIAERQDDENVIVYDRKKQFLFLSDYYSWETACTKGRYWWRWIDALEYRDKKCFNSDGDVIADIYDTDALTTCSEYSMDYPLEPHMAEITGMADILRLIAGVAKVNIVDLDFEDSFESILSDIICRADFPWQQDFDAVYGTVNKPRNLKAFGPDSNSPIHRWCGLKSHGYDMDAQSFEAAAGLPADILKAVSGFDEYHSVKEALATLKKSGLSEIATKWLSEDIPVSEWPDAIQLAEKTSTNLETAIRHFHRGKENGFDAYQILRCYRDLSKNGFASEISLNGSFTQKTCRRAELLLDKTLSLEQYKTIAARPTMDTFLKAMDIA